MVFAEFSAVLLCFRVIEFFLHISVELIDGGEFFFFVFQDHFEALQLIVVGFLSFFFYFGDEFEAVDVWVAGEVAHLVF